MCGSDSTGFVTNDSGIVDVPGDVLRFLERGPKFRVPPKLNDGFEEMAKFSLDILTYKLRWMDKCQNNDNILNLRENFFILFTVSCI